MAMQTGIINATTLGIYVGSTKIANLTGANLSVTQGLRTSVNKDDGGWEKSHPGARSWSMGGDSEFAFDAGYGVDDLYDAIFNRTKLTIKFSTEIAGDYDFEGDAYLESLELSGGAEENATYSFSLKGTAALVRATI
jgi:predicted secreted protein